MTTALCQEEILLIDDILPQTVLRVCIAQQKTHKYIHNMRKGFNR